MAAKSGCVFAHTHRMTVRIRWCIVVRKNRLFGQPLASCTYAGSHSRSHYSFMLFVNPAMAKNTFFSRFNSLCLVWLLNKYRLYAFANLHTLAIDTCSGMKKLNWQRENFVTQTIERNGFRVKRISLYFLTGPGRITIAKSHGGNNNNKNKNLLQCHRNTVRILSVIQNTFIQRLENYV